MTDREKLIVLLCEAIEKGRDFCNAKNSCNDCEYKKFGMGCLETYWCDHLLANGVVVLPRYDTGMAYMVNHDKKIVPMYVTQTCSTGNGDFYVTAVPVREAPLKEGK